MWTISKLTVKEIIYKRVFTVIFLLSLLFLIVYGIGTHFTQVKLIHGRSSLHVMEKGFFSTQLIGMGLYLAAFMSSLLAIFSACGSVSREIESGQIDPVLSRPLPRHSFIMGRTMGLSILLLLYSLVMFMGVTCINKYVGGHLAMSFTSTQLAQALGLFLLQPIILIAASIFCSTRFSTLNSGIIMVMTYVITMIGGFIEQFGALLEEQTMIHIGIISSLLFPLDSVFRKMTLSLFAASDDPLSFATSGIFGSASIPSNLMIVYAAFYGVIALFFAIRLFKSRDL